MSIQVSHLTIYPRQSVRRSLRRALIGYGFIISLIATATFALAPGAALARISHKHSHKQSAPTQSTSGQPILGGDLGLGQQAFAAIDHGHLDIAERLAWKIKDPYLSDSVKAELYEKAPTDFSYKEIATFLARHPAWPGRAALVSATEMRMPSGFPDRDVVAWFEINPPQTLNGFYRYAEALGNLGEDETLKGKIKDYWVRANFNTEDESGFRQRYGHYLNHSDDMARFDRLIWDEQMLAAHRMIARLGDDGGLQALARARLALAESEPGAESLIADVPERLQDDEGLLYERLHWRRTHDLTDGAVEILRNAPDTLSHPDLWWTERQIIVRRVLASGDRRLAYDLAANHGGLKGESLAEAEWLAGWIALRKLNQPDRAYEHFTQMYMGVGTPISHARAAYWLGRVADVKKDDNAAQQFYEDAAVYNTTFYGQLAALNLSTNQELTAQPEPSLPHAWVENYMAGELPSLVRIMHKIGQDKRAAAFLHTLADAATMRAEFAELVHLAEDIHRPDLQVQTCKIAAQRNILLVEGGYPILLDRFMPRSVSLEPALIHAIIRQESMFKSDAASPVGAIGLMQLMPATARGISRSLGMRFNPNRLATDYAYNIELGSTYIRHTIDEFGGSYILAIASYNAGAGRVREWIQMNGDPRDPDVDPIDWIESIPVAETRNYVERVLDGLQVYRARLGNGAAPLKLASDLRRGGHGFIVGQKEPD